LYGLHQAPRAWYAILSTYLLENRFRRSNIDKTLFIKKDKDNAQEIPDEFYRELTFFLRLQVKQKDDGIFINQDKYVADILKKFDFVLGIQNQMLDYGFNFMNTKIYIDNESTICIMKNLVFYSKTKNIEIRHHFIRDSYEKKLIQVIKIHIYHNVTDLLTKAFDVSRKANRTTGISQYSGPIPLVTDETIIKEWEDRMEKATTTASSLKAEQDSGNTNRTQSMATLNESFPQGTDLGSSPRCQDTLLGGAKDQTRLNLLLPVLVYAARHTLTVVRLNLLKPVLVYTARHTLTAVRHKLMLPGITCYCWVKTVNGERQLQALVDKKKVIIIETSIRSDLHLEDAGGIDCLPTTTIFEELARMGRNQQKTTAVPHPSDSTTAVPNEESVPTHSNDPLLSGEDRLKLTDLIDMCTKLFERVLDLEHTKIAQAQEITKLKLRVKKLEKKARSIEDIDKDAEVSLVDETQGRLDDVEIFNTDELIGNEVFVENDMIEKDQDMIPKEVSTAAPSTTAVSPPVITEVEITLAQTLAKLKSTKSKVVIQEPVQSTTTAAPLIIPKAKGITFRDAGESTTRAPTPLSSLSIKDKGKDKMDEDEVPLKKKDQIALDEEMARNLKAQIQAELIKEERFTRKKEEEALIESWDNTQAMMKAYFELVQRLQAEEQGEITIEERLRLFVELMNKIKKHFTKLRAEEKKRKPPTKAQKRNIMSTYLKNMGGYKYNQLKSKSYDEIQKLFDNEMKIEDEIESDKSKKAESSEKKAAGSRKKSIGKKRKGNE
ncbi:hypothetical protein Tco_0994800, partial [Tanacetum coccineum]